MSSEEDDARSQGISSIIDGILDQYRFQFEPEYRLKFKKDLAGFSLGIGVSKPHEIPTRLRLTLKPPHSDDGLQLGRFVQKVLVMPQQHFVALYSRKLSWGFLRCQFVAGYSWDRRKPSLDYRLSTKWDDGIRFKRKEYYAPTDNLLLRAKWNLAVQLPDVEGHLGGAEGSTQAPMDIEYGGMELSVTQIDWVCDLDGLKDRRRAPLALAASTSMAALPAAVGDQCSAPAQPAKAASGRPSWPW